MRDEGHRERVSFDLKDSPNFTFARALTVVKAAYRMIGEPDPLNPKNRSLNGNGVWNGNGNGNGKGDEEFNSPLYATEVQPILKRTTVVTTTQAYLQLQKSPAHSPNTGAQVELKSSISQEEFNKLMSNFMSSMGFSKSEQPIGSRLQPSRLRQPGSYCGGYRASITCFNCGLWGHYSDGCTNP